MRSANASKAKQATSRKKLIDKLTLDELPVSTRRPPFIQFKPNRACGDRILRVRNLTVKNDAGETLLDGINFDVNPSDKIAFVGEHTLSTTAFFDAITDASNQDEGPVEWGQTITYSYLPSNHDQYFENPVSLMEWLRPFSDKDSDDSSLRAYLGRMLFSQDEAKKMCNVLSGGEKMRCMFAKMMREEANALVFDNPTDHLAKNDSRRESTNSPNEVEVSDSKFVGTEDHVVAELVVGDEEEDKSEGQKVKKKCFSSGCLVGNAMVVLFQIVCVTSSEVMQYQESNSHPYVHPYFSVWWNHLATGKMSIYGRVDFRCVDHSPALMLYFSNRA